MSAMKLVVLLVCCLALSEARKGKLKNHHKKRIHDHMKNEGDVDAVVAKAEPHFDELEKKLNANWTEEEKNERFVNVAKNVHSVDEHNKNPKHKYKVRMNDLAHLHEHERKGMLGHMHVHHEGANSSLFERPKRQTPPASMDWRTKGAVTPVKNQGTCGSCWAFSATGALEGAIAIKTKTLTSLSESHLVSCSSAYGNQACDGGVTMWAFDFAKDNGGVQTSAAYPYTEIATPETSPPAKCRLTPPATRSSRFGTSSGNAKMIAQNDERALMAAVGLVGPVSVAIYVPSDPDMSFFNYESGIYHNDYCDGQPNHAVLVVGYGSENGDDYWIVKNSWSANWGEKGYIRMARNRGGQCGIASEASFPLVAAVNTAKLAPAAPSNKPSGGGSAGGIVSPW